MLTSFFLDLDLDLDQRSEIRDQRSEIRDQRSEIRDQRSIFYIDNRSLSIIYIDKELYASIRKSSIITFMLRSIIRMILKENRMGSTPREMTMPDLYQGCTVNSWTDPLDKDQKFNFEVVDKKGKKHSASFPSQEEGVFWARKICGTL